MSERLGFVYYGDEPIGPSRRAEFGFGKEISDESARVVDEEVKRIVDAAYADTRQMIEANRERLEAIADALVKYETLDGEEVRKIVAGQTIDRPTVADLIAAEQTRRDQLPPVARPVKQPPLDEEPGSLPSPA